MASVREGCARRAVGRARRTDEPLCRADDAAFAAGRAAFLAGLDVLEFFVLTATSNLYPALCAQNGPCDRRTSR